MRTPGKGNQPQCKGPEAGVPGTFKKEQSPVRPVQRSR